MIENQTERNVLVRQLGLDAEGEATLDQALTAQRRINRKQAELDSLLMVRRCAVLGLHDQYRVTKYRIAKVLGVSQTTIGNITREKE